nr:hypothetical protein [Microbacterium resistens]
MLFPLGLFRRPAHPEWPAATRELATGTLLRFAVSHPLDQHGLVELSEDAHHLAHGCARRVFGIVLRDQTDQCERVSVTGCSASRSSSLFPPCVAFS